MKTIEFEGRKVKVYSFFDEKQMIHSLTVLDGIPIIVEWMIDVNYIDETSIPNIRKVKIESSQSYFKSGAKVCISKMLKYNIERFVELYKELKIDKHSEYFQFIRSIAEKELLHNLDVATKLQFLLNNK